MNKRVFDILAALFGLVACSPILVVVALLIKLDSHGPIFFKQIRMGRGFRPFHIFKFRTMIQDSSRQGGPLTVGNDPRITRIGQILRRYKVDELPQLINILKGDMSLVGPRPEVPYYVEMFQTEYQEILKVRPGLTDVASLRYMEEEVVLKNADRPEQEYQTRVLPEKLRLAAIYIHHSSFSFDLAIIMQTLINLFGGKYEVFELPELKNIEKQAESNGRASLRRTIIKCRRSIVLFLDLFLIVFANYLAFWLRFDGDIPEKATMLLLQMLPWLVVIRGVSFPFSACMKVFGGIPVSGICKGLRVGF